MAGRPARWRPRPHLGALHADPAREWSVDSLAAEAASRRLLESEAAVLEVALSGGYGSEAAFSRAFRRLTGSPAPRR